MKRFAIVVSLLLFVSLPMINRSIAQGDKVKCDLTGINKQIAAFKPTGDNKADLKVLLALDEQIRAANLACNGMIFQRSGAKIIGPLDLPEGTYKTTVKTQSLGFIAEMKVSKGSCTASGTMGSMGYLYQVINIEQKQLEEENLIESQGCTVTIVTSNVTGAWTLSIEPLQ